MLDEWDRSTPLIEGSICDEGRHYIGIDIRSWSSIFDVSFVTSCCGSWNSDRCGPVSDSEWELIFTGCLMMTGQSFWVITVNFKMELMAFAETVNDLIDIVHSSLSFSHLYGWIICVTASSVPVLEELWSKTDSDLVVFSNPCQDVPGNPHHITDFYSFARTDLELPLSWHDFRIRTRDLDLSVEASFDQSIIDHSSKASGSTYRAIVRTLRLWVPTWRPSERLHVESALVSKERVLLFNTKPRFVRLNSIENLGGMSPEVCVCWLKLCERGVWPHIGITEYK